MKVQLSVLAAALALNACSWNDNRWLPREIYQPTSTAWSTQPGTNSVTGQAMFTTLTGETRGLIGARALGLMKPTAYFITTARGFIHDEDALAQVLENVWTRFAR